MISLMSHAGIDCTGLHTVASGLKARRVEPNTDACVLFRLPLLLLWTSGAMG